MNTSPFHAKPNVSFHFKSYVGFQHETPEPNLPYYRSGKDKLFGFFVGQVMKATQGKGNPQQVIEEKTIKLDNKFSVVYLLSHNSPVAYRLLKQKLEKIAMREFCTKETAYIVTVAVFLFLAAGGGVGFGFLFASLTHDCLQYLGYPDLPFGPDPSPDGSLVSDPTVPANTTNPNSFKLSCERNLGIGMGIGFVVAVGLFALGYRCFNKRSQEAEASTPAHEETRLLSRG